MPDFGLWHLIGIGLVLWVAYDLFMGYSYSYRLVQRADEPLYYWLTVALWSLVAVATLAWA